MEGLVLIGCSFLSALILSVASDPRLFRSTCYMLYAVAAERKLPTAASQLSVY